MYMYVKKTKALIRGMITTQLSCAFVFAYVKSRFSHCVAQMVDFMYLVIVDPQNEPCCKKTCLRGFRPGPTQTELYNHKRCLEA